MTTIQIYVRPDQASRVAQGNAPDKYWSQPPAEIETILVNVPAHVFASWSITPPRVEVNQSANKKKTLWD